MAHIERNMIPLYLTGQEKSQLDLHANALDISRQKLLEALIKSAFEDLESMDKIGFLVSEVRVIDQINMFKKLTRQGVDNLAKNQLKKEF